MSNRTLKDWIPILLWMLFIYWMSTGTFSSENTELIIEPLLKFLMPGISPHTIKVIHALIRKIGHVTEYFVLGVLLFRAFRDFSPAASTWRWAVFAVIVVALYAASDEFHQSFVPSRTASIIDMGIDTAGGVLAQIGCLLWHFRGRKQAAYS